MAEKGVAWPLLFVGGLHDKKRLGYVERCFGDA